MVHAKYFSYRLIKNNSTNKAFYKTATHRAKVATSLHADSPLSVYLHRYNAHITKTQAFKSVVLDNKYPATAFHQKA